MPRQILISNSLMVTKHGNTFLDRFATVEWGGRRARDVVLERALSGKGKNERMEALRTGHEAKNERLCWRERAEWVISRDVNQDARLMRQSGASFHRIHSLRRKQYQNLDSGRIKRERGADWDTPPTRVPTTHRYHFWQFHSIISLYTNPLPYHHLENTRPFWVPPK